VPDGGVSVAMGGGRTVVVGRVGGSVIVDSCDVVVSLIMVDVLSLQPQNRPGVRHVVLVVLVVLVVEFVVFVGSTAVVVVVVVLSLQPNQPLEKCQQTPNVS